MATVVSFVNLSGGAGKTTMTVNLAAYLAGPYGRRVLLIDLDPQASSAAYLVAQDVWDAQNRAGRTLAQLFRDQMEGKHIFDLDAAILRGVAEVPGLDLLPSSLSLVDIQDELSRMPSQVCVDPVKILATSLTEEIRRRYDYVVIDCSHLLRLLTMNGTIMSDYFVIPVAPDILSNHGIQITFNRLYWLKGVRHARIEYAGIIFCKVRPNSFQRRKMAELRASYSKVYETVLYDRAILSLMAKGNRPLLTAEALMHRPDWAEVNEVFMACTAEFIAHTGPGEDGRG